MSSQEKVLANLITYIDICHMLVNFHDLIRLMSKLPFTNSRLRHSGYSTCEQIMIALGSGQSTEFKLLLEYKRRMCETK